MCFFACLKEFLQSYIERVILSTAGCNLSDRPKSLFPILSDLVPPKDIMNSPSSSSNSSLEGVNDILERETPTTSKNTLMIQQQPGEINDKKIKTGKKKHNSKNKKNGTVKKPKKGILCKKKKKKKILH